MPNEFLDLDTHLMWCLKHIAPLQGRNKLIHIMATGMLLDALMGDRNFHEACKGNMDNIEANLASIAPACCYLGSSVIRYIYARVGANLGPTGPLPN